MKAILTLLFVLTLGVTAQAQNTRTETKVETVKTTIVTVTSYEKVNLGDESKLVRLYKFKNSRIKKALTFTTKRNKAKMA